MNYRIISCFLLFHSVSWAQSPKEQQFQQTVKEVVRAFSTQNKTALIPYINRDIGIYQLDKVGVFGHYNHLQSVSFSDQGYPQVLFTYSKGVKVLPLTYAKLPTWNCDKEQWSKRGMFVDTTQTNHLLSQTCKDRNHFVPDHIPTSLIKQVYSLENKSRRVVVADSQGRELVFYLSYINRKWYWTIIDNLSSDCSI